MSITEPIGYLASALVLATFSMRDMAALRWMAIASNLAFIGYGSLADVGPVLVLHLLLLPLNLARLREASVAARAVASAEAARRHDALKAAASEAVAALDAMVGDA